MIDLDQLRKDMEAGTDGPWSVGGDGTRVKPMPMDQFFRPVADVGPDIRWENGTWVEYGREEANARRIARLPDLERAYLELREAADALADAVDTIEAVEDGADLDAAYRALIEKLLAYREATQ